MAEPSYRTVLAKQLAGGDVIRDRGLVERAETRRLTGHFGRGGHGSTGVGQGAMTAYITYVQVPGFPELIFFPDQLVDVEESSSDA